MLRVKAIDRQEWARAIKEEVATPAPNRVAIK